VIEEWIGNMHSSHAVKRFFRTFNYYLIGCFQIMLRKLFIWRLKIEKPEIIILGMDTMVMNNEEAKKRGEFRLHTMGRWDFNLFS